MLAKQNPHPYDNRIVFNERNHTYALDGSSTNMVSCTSFKSMFFKKFNAEDAIANILKSDKYSSDPDYKYFNKTSDVIKKEWSDANKLGTHLHSDIENYLNGLKVANDSKEFAYFQSFLKDNADLSPYRTEWRIFSELLRLSGTIDAVFRDKDGNYILLDWKRSIVTYGEFENASFPLEHLKDNNFIQYSIQLNLYRQILEDYYNIRIKAMFLIELHPDNDSYKKIETPRMENEIYNLFTYRAEGLKKLGYTTPELSKYVYTKSPTVAVSNKGKRWTDDEDNKLILLATSGKSPKSIALQHGRSEHAIHLRILRHASLLLNHQSKEDVCQRFNIRIDDLENYVQSQIKETKKKDPKSTFEDVIEKLKYDPSSPSSTSSAEILEEIRPLKRMKKKTIVLSEKQNLCLKMMKEGQNLFLTGQAGTGKSMVISTFVRLYQHQKIIAVTATTGTAAVLLNGTTLFSYLGIGLGTASADLLIIQLKKKKMFLKRWMDLDVLIIDEVSMLSPALFDKLELVARSLRHNAKPFGGIQLILTGDFFQLPNINQKDMFCFDAESWEGCIGKNVIHLDINFRQEEDDVYQKCLNEVRYGILGKDTLKILKSRENVILTNEFGITPTKIYSLNINVDEENEVQLDKLNDGEIEFKQYDLTYKAFKKVNMIDEKIKKECNAPLVLQLCKGAQVMLLYNMDIESKLVNGSRGVVHGFDSNDSPIIKFLSGAMRTIPMKVWEIEENGDVVIEVTQIPLKLAYATTVHRSQGATIDYAEVDMEGIFEYGQAYVALSRVKSLEGLSIKTFKPDVIRAHPRVIEFYNQYI